MTTSIREDVERAGPSLGGLRAEGRQETMNVRRCHEDVRRYLRTGNFRTRGHLQLVTEVDGH